MSSSVYSDSKRCLPCARRFLFTYSRSRICRKQLSRSITLTRSIVAVRA